MTLEPIVQYQVPTYRETTIQALANFRQEWEEVAESESLVEITAPIGLLLADIAGRLELNPKERFEFLGKSLIGDVEVFTKQRAKPTD